MSIEEIPAEVVAEVAASIDQPIVAELSGQSRYDDIMARATVDPTEVSDEDLDFIESFDPSAEETPAPVETPAPTEDPLAEAMKLVGAKDVSELGAKVRELRGKVGEIGDKSNRELQELKAIAERREQHERFVSALASGDANAWAALEKIRPGSIAAAQAQPNAEDEIPDDVLDPKAWAAAQKATREAAALREQLSQITSWQQQQMAREVQEQQHAKDVSMTLGTVSKLVQMKPELAAPNLIQELNEYMWSPVGQEPSVSDSARTIIGAMELGEKLGIPSLAQAVDMYQRLYPSEAKVTAPTTPVQAPPAPKQALPGMVAARAMGGSAGVEAYTHDQIMDGDFPDHWIGEGGKPNYQAIPQQYHNLF